MARCVLRGKLDTVTRNCTEIPSFFGDRRSAGRQPMRGTGDRTCWVRAWRSKDAPLLAYLLIFGASICGFAGVTAWIVPIGALGLASISAVEHRQLYRKARDIGLAEIADETLLGSVWNGLLATSVAYGGGVVFHFLTAGQV
jgi:hypothetical protein